jgi:hypothetical protein
MSGVRFEGPVPGTVTGSCQDCDVPQYSLPRESRSRQAICTSTASRGHVHLAETVPGTVAGV